MICSTIRPHKKKLAQKYVDLPTRSVSTQLVNKSDVRHKAGMTFHAFGLRFFCSQRVKRASEPSQVSPSELF